MTQLTTIPNDLNRPKTVGVPAIDIQSNRVTISTTRLMWIPKLINLTGCWFVGFVLIGGTVVSLLPHEFDADLTRQAVVLVPLIFASVHAIVFLLTNPPKPYMVIEKSEPADEFPAWTASSLVPDGTVLRSRVTGIETDLWREPVKTKWRARLLLRTENGPRVIAALPTRLGIDDLNEKATQLASAMGCECEMAKSWPLPPS